MLAYLINYLMTYLPQDEEGQGMVEYSLILVLISIAAIGVMVFIGPNLRSVFQEVVDNLIVPS